MLYKISEYLKIGYKISYLLKKIEDKEDISYILYKLSDIIYIFIA